MSSVLIVKSSIFSFADWASTCYIHLICCSLFAPPHPAHRLLKKNNCFKTHNLPYPNLDILKNFIYQLNPLEVQKRIIKLTKMSFAEKVALNVAGTNLYDSALLLCFVKPVFQHEHFSHFCSTQEYQTM